MTAASARRTAADVVRQRRSARCWRGVARPSAQGAVRRCSIVRPGCACSSALRTPSSAGLLDRPLCRRGWTAAEGAAARERLPCTLLSLSAERAAACHGARAWQVLPAATKQRRAPQRQCCLGSAGRRAGARLHTARPHTLPQRQATWLVRGKTAAPIAFGCSAAWASWQMLRGRRLRAIGPLSAARCCGVHSLRCCTCKGCTHFRGGWLSSVGAAQRATKHCLRLSGDAASAYAPVLSNQPGLHQPSCWGQHTRGNQGTRTGVQTCSQASDPFGYALPFR